MLEVLLVTPVCASDLHIRSLVLTAEDKLSITTNGKKGAFLEVDGIEVGQLNAGDKIDIVRSPEKAKIIKMNDKSFLKTLRKKFCR